MKKVLLNFLITSLFLGMPAMVGTAAASAQTQEAKTRNCTISGYIYDKDSGEPLIGAAVIDKATFHGSVSGNSGFYSLTLPQGRHEIIISYIGYHEYKQIIDLKENFSISFRISQATDELAESVVTASRNDTGVRGTQMSAIEIPINQIKAVPAIGGEVDIIKAIQLLPGVQSGTEGSAGFYVRGGGADENLLLMDGVPLYNVSHLMGFFSVFNADAVKNVTLYKGSFPARFGGHLSSVVDVRMNDGNDQEFHGNVSVGAISSKISLEGPIVKGRTTFNVSARRTYLDLLAKPALFLVNREHKDDDLNYMKVDGGYDFYDFNAKITHKFKNQDRLSISFYRGDDKAFVKDRQSSYGENIFYDNSGEQVHTGVWETSKDSFGLGWNWGNTLGSVRWNHEVSPTLYMSASANYTQYRSLLKLDVDTYNKVFDSNNNTTTESSDAVMMQYRSLINDLGSMVDFDWRPDVNHDIKFGGGYTYHNFRPGIISMNARIDGLMDEEFKFEREIGNTSLYAHEVVAYGEDNWTVTPWLKANLGLHASVYNVDGKTYGSVEPRLSARALITDNLSAKASYSEMSQYIHLLCNSSLSLPSDLWVPVTKNIKPMRSRQVAVGLSHEKNGFEYSAEAYYKTMENVLEYRDGASYLGTSTGWEEKVCMGRGWSYGLELMIQKKVGKTTGWIGYTLAKAMRQFDRYGMVINDGNPFPAKYDRRHDLSVTLSHAFNKKYDIGATFILASGNCGTLAFEEYEMLDINGRNQSRGEYIPHRNNYRMPLYNRLDLGANYHKQKKHGVATWNISVYNAYNRLNPFIVQEGYDDEAKKPALVKVSIFPIIPTISYTFKF